MNTCSPAKCSFRRLQPTLRSLSALALLQFIPGQAFAVNRTWDGSDNIDFEAPANWTALPSNNLTSDIGVFSGALTTYQPQLSISRNINGLLISTSTGGWTLGSGSGANVLTLGGNGISTSGQTSGTNSLSANLAIGAAQTWVAGTGGTLLVTGSVTGIGGFPLTVNSTGNLGNVILSPAAGNNVSLTGASNSNFFLIVRSGGLLVLGGDGVSAPVTASVNTIVNNSTGSTYGAMAITGGGAVRVNSGTWNLGDLAKNGGSDYFSGSLEVNEGEISFKGARYLAAGSITVGGGSLKITNTGSIYSNGGKFSLGSVGSSGTATMTVTGGQVDLAQANGGNSIGTAISTKVLQSGGTFSNGITPGGGTNGGTATTFTIGHSGMTSTGSGATLTYTAASNILASYTLTNGALLSAGAIQATTPASAGTNGSSGSPPNAVVSSGTGNVRNFNFNGGNLSVGAFIATNLGYSSSTGLPGAAPNTDPTVNSVGIGTLYNNGGTLAPGGVGTAGKTTITGGYSVNAGTFAVDLGGSTQATAFQTGQYDFVTASGTATLGGKLTLNLIGGHVPQNGDSHTILTAGSLTGGFTNVAFGSRVATSNGVGCYLVSKVGNSVTLGQYEPLTAPVITSQPASQSVTVGSSATFAVAVTSSVQPDYQWRRNGIPMSGKTGLSLTFSSASFADAGTYDVVVTTAAGSVASSPAILTVNLFGPEVMGERPISYDFTGVRAVPQVPPIGAHPRIYFSPDQLPDIRNRLANTTVGVEAMTMIRLYTDMMRRGRSLAYDSKPSGFKTMPDGTGRLSNPGLYDKSVNYNLLVSGAVTGTVGTTLVGVANDTSTGRYALAGEMALEAFECLVDEGQPGVATRAANLAAALDTWAQWVLTLSDFPGPAGATFNNRSLNQDRFGGHLNALTYDMIHPAMSTAQRNNVRKAIAELMSGFFATDNSDSEYTGVGMAPEAVATNHVTINSFRILTACAIEGEVTVADAGFSAADLDGWFRRAMGAYHKFFTYGWFASGAPLEGMGKNYLFGAHMIPYARRGYDFFGHPHLKAYKEKWLPAIMQPFGYSFLEYDLLGGSGPNVERGRGFIESLDYTGLKWMFPDDNAADFAWRNYVRTEYKDAGGNWQTFLDLRDGKFGLRSVYSHQLLPAAIFASDVASTATWTQQNTAVQGSPDYLDAEGGTLSARSGYDPDATALVFHVRQDFGGHTFADRNTFTLSALGRLFINYNSGSSSSGAEEGGLNSVIEVDGKSMKVSDKEGDKMRIPSKLAAWSPLGGMATFATGDATYAYSQEWWWNAYTTGSTTLKSGFVVDRNSHNHFRRAGNKIPEAFGDAPFVSFPHWEAPGQFEGIQAKPYNPMRQVYRTIGLVRGAKPYALVVDDVRKDDATHSYRWVASIPKDLILVSGASLPAGANPATDLVLQEPAATGNRRLLVRILNASGTPALGTAYSINPNPGKVLNFSNPVEGSAFAYTQTVSNTATSESWKRLVIERANVVAPDFRILLFPFRNGDALPTSDLIGNTLTVTLGSQNDTFSFAPRSANVGGQNVTMNEFTLSRGGTTLLDYRNQIEPTAVRGPAGVLDVPPAAPTSLNATRLSGSQIKLTWVDNATGESAYVVERTLAGKQNWQSVASTLPANTTTFTDETVQVSTGYDYRVRCVGSAVSSDYATAEIIVSAGISDGTFASWRLQHFGDGLADLPGVSGQNDDPDGDGCTNQHEFLAGTVPTDSGSVFKMLGLTPASGGFQLSFTAIPGKVYQVERGADPASVTWTLVADDLTTSGTSIEITVTPAPGESRGFYRARVKN